MPESFPKTGMTGRVTRFLVYGWIIGFFCLHLVNAWGLTDMAAVRTLIGNLFFLGMLAGAFVLWCVFSLRMMSLRPTKAVVAWPWFFVMLWFTVIVIMNGGASFALGGGEVWRLFVTAVRVTGSLVALSLFLASSFVVGKKALRSLRVADLDGIESIVLSSVLGAGGWGLVAAGLGIFSLADTRIAYLLVLAVLVLGFGDLRDLFRRLCQVRLGWSSIAGGWLERAAGILLIILFVVASTYALAGIVNARFDSLSQYLTFPDIYAQWHGLVPFPFHPYWGFPQLTESVFLFGMLLGGENIPFLMSLAFLALGLFGMTRMIGGARQGENVLWPLVVFVGAPFILVFTFGHLKVEPFLFLGTVAIFVITRRILSGRGTGGHWIALGLLLGLVVSIKYTAAVLVMSVLFGLLVFRKRSGLNRKRVLLTLGISALVFSPWAVKDLVYYGNPFYPIFTGRDFFTKSLGMSCQSFLVRYGREDPILVWQNDRYMRGERFSTDYGRFSGLSLLFRALVSGFPTSFNGLGPFFIIFLPFVIRVVFRSGRVEAKFLLSVSAFYVLVAALSFDGQVWYFMPAIVAFVSLIRIVMDDWRSEPGGRFLKMLMLIWLFIGVSYFTLDRQFEMGIRYFRGDVDLNVAFPDHDLYEMGRYVDEHVLAPGQPGGIVYGFSDPQGYFIKDSDRNFVPDMFGYLFGCLSQDGKEYERLKRIGISYVLYDPESYPLCAATTTTFDTCRSRNAFVGFIAEHGELIHSEGRFELYRLK